MDITEQLAIISRPNVEKFEWMEEVELLLGTVELLPKIQAECIEARRIGLDLETSGLDQRAFPTDVGALVINDKIVGFCIAPTTKRSYYIPLRHIDYEGNIPPRLMVDFMRALQEAGVVCVFHNAKFDTKFLKHDPAGAMGEWDDPKVWDDTLVLTYLRNSRQKAKGLKFMAKTELNREMIELEQLFQPEDIKARRLNFAKLDPTWEPVVWYAAADAINTLALYELLAPLVLEADQFGNRQVTIYTIEKICLVATQWMEQCRIYIDREKLMELIRLGQQEWWDCLLVVYEEVGSVLGRDIRPGWVKSMAPYDASVLEPNYMSVREMAKRTSQPDPRPVIKKSVPSLTDRKVRETVEFPPAYDITIPASLGLLLRELGVEGLEATPASGQVKTSKDVLEKVIDRAGKKHAWMKKVKRFREVMKSLGNVLFNIYRDTTPERSPDGCVWANFNGARVDTGRFSTPTPKKSASFFGQVNWNVQSTQAHYFNPKDPPPECVYRQREVVAARPGHILFAIDYSGVELRIVTNISGEPKWLAEFFRCATCEHEFGRDELPPPFCPKCGSDKIGDLHSLTTLGIYGEEIKKDSKLFKLKRQIGKIVNFLLCYGGSGYAVMQSTGVDKPEGFRIKNQFDKTYKGLLRWWRSQEKVADKMSYVLTAFGRKYPVPDIHHADNFFRSKAKRNAVNGPVQGSSADIMKFAMGLLYREFKKRGWICVAGQDDLVKMVITIHDELVFEIKEELVQEAIPVIEKIMCENTVNKLNWIVPLKVDIEFGPDWTVPFNLTEMTWNKGGGDWTPKLVSLFPDRYQNYLACGGKPVGDVEVPAPKVTSVMPTKSVEMITEAASGLEPVHQETYKRNVRPEMEGEAHIYKIARSKMTADNARKLAHVVHRCQGRGVDLLRVRDELGNDLLGVTVKVAFEEFRVLANYEGF